jgi:D-threo-aldose 1-dehydrogenase
VPLKAVALQFPLGHKQVAAVIPGANSAAQVEENLRNLKLRIPAEFWAELCSEGLLHANAPVPA